MKKLSQTDIKNKYLAFMQRHGHKLVPGNTVVPENDPSLLFIPAGMAPLKPYLLGKPHPLGNRLTNSQRCIRTIDIEEVGDNTHLTSFEMLGNWSLNDYFKAEAIHMTFEFLTEELGIDPNRLYASVFEGNENAPLDKESIEIWKKEFASKGIKAEFGKGERIQAFGVSDNWWEMESGGPCGPSSEIFIDTGKTACGPDCNINCDCGKYVELGNNVFMEYLKEDGEYKPLNGHNVDFGGGLERITAVVQGVNSVWEIDTYTAVFNDLSLLSSKEDKRAQRIITDHLRTAIWIINDGVKPGRTQREYILRRLIRRAIRQGHALGINENFTTRIAQSIMDNIYPEEEDIHQNRENILEVLEEEENKFRKSLKQSLKEVTLLIEAFKNSNTDTYTNPGGESFSLFETYGFPPEMLIEELEKNGIRVDYDKFWEEHEQAFKKHQEQSRTASKGLFKGGLLDQSENSVRLHTATHLLLKALYDELGPHIHQAGSNITPERLRLDFPNKEKLTEEQLKRIEDTVNEQIRKGLDVHVQTMSKEEALKAVPYPAFEDRYPDVVTVYIIGDEDNPYSKEICTGPHVKNTSELGHFKIIKHESVGAGIKRIKAILEN